MLPSVAETMSLDKNDESGVGLVAVYKGQTVAVYRVAKSEVNLTRRDLVELVNVRSNDKFETLHLTPHLCN
jgi:hypothetical protein